MGGLRYITSSNIIILPKNCILGNSRLANQPFFKYIKRKITPTEIQKIMQKKVGLHRQLCWRAGLLHSFSSKMVRALFNICCHIELSVSFSTVANGSLGVKRTVLPFNERFDSTILIICRFSSSLATSKILSPCLNSCNRYEAVA